MSASAPFWARSCTESRYADAPIKNVELGGELILGERQTFLGENGVMQRVDLMGRYFF